ncbi:MAG: hypothetical protein OEV00_08780 [Acidobacteriota bacterium]|nr:hypothetical protein [Acidobacteriota bacterium]MDH3785405.1 hypothetical protein [Acidobacteriota bacterium]
MIRRLAAVVLILLVGVSALDARPKKKKRKNQPPPPSRCDAVRLDGDRLFVGSTGGLVWHDVSDPYSATTIDNFFLRNAVWDMAVRDRYAMIAVGTHGVYSIDFEHEDGMQVIYRHEVPGKARQLEWVGDALFVAAGRHGVEVISTRYADRLQRIAHLAARDRVRAIAIVDQRLFVVDSGSGLSIYDISRPSSPRLLTDRRLEATVWDVVVDGDLIYLAADDDGILAFRLDAKTLTPLPTIPTTIRAYRIDVGSGALVVTDGRSSMEVLDGIPDAPRSRGVTVVHRSATTTDIAVDHDLVVIAGGTQCFTLFGIGDPEETERYSGQRRKMTVEFP